VPLQTSVRTGWKSSLSRLALAALLFEGASGLVITFAAFHAAVEWTVLVHTVLGLLAVIPITWYLLAHWLDYKRYSFSDTVLLGYLAGVALLACSLSGLVVTWQGAFGDRMSPLWRDIHLWSTVAMLVAAAPHAVLVYARYGRKRVDLGAGSLLARIGGAMTAGALAIYALSVAYSGVRYVNEFPAGYHYLYGEDRPFAPSLATTTTGGAFDADSLAGSDTCGTSRCHTQIVEEWRASAHRWSAMDPFFQKIQTVMAQQNGPESTRYCGGCHDPISLFSGTKNILVEDLTGLRGFQEGISCLSCHGVRETDLQGNANYVMTQPPSYLWQWKEAGLGKQVSDFLIRTYPDEHGKLSKRVYKAPEYCAACHKQFIDEEVNRVGWVQLQNQYDNWKASHWFVEGDPTRTIECRECHMPLVASTDPARGDTVDYNRTADDGEHRSHRFVGANSLVPALLQVEGWESQVRLTQEWLKGTYAIPEIADKWREGAVVQMALEVPPSARPGERIPLRLVMTANKVGHDFPTGPLDIIQSWVEIHVYDPNGNEIFSSGTRDEKNFIAPGSFLFKAEPVDQYGNLIDRHNLWEMVGVRYRRAIFPGYSDTVEYLVDCPTAIAPGAGRAAIGGEGDVRELELPAPEDGGSYRVVASLLYRKIDQYLINFMLGEDSGLTAPVIEMNRVEATIAVGPQQTATVRGDSAPAPAG
jgi:Cytochrome c554 and c-prime